MSTIHRICPICGKDTPLDARHCPHCGHDTQSDLPVPQGASLPMVVGKAALPVLVGVGTLAVRMVWKLLRDRWTLPVANVAVDAVTKTAPFSSPARIDQPSQPVRSQRTIRIRSSWAVGDANGVLRQGQVEHVIEIDE